MAGVRSFHFEPTGTSVSPTLHVPNGLPLRLVVLACAAYTLSQFFRSSVGVLAPGLMESLSLSPEELGRLGGFFFLMFALAQLPLGILLDRFGPRRVTALVMLIAASGAFTFSFFTSFEGLLLGRGLMGIGCSVCLMGSLVLFSRWIPQEKFATTAGLVLGVGGLGGILATVPLEAAAEWIGWRGAFVFMGFLTVAIAAIFWIAVTDAPEGVTPSSSEAPPVPDGILRGFMEIFGKRDLWFMLPMSFTGYGALLMILGLWGAPYLKDVQGLDSADRANMLLATAAMWNVGCLVFGRLDRAFDTRKGVVIAGGVGLALTIALISLIPPVPIWVNVLIFGWLGFVGAFSVLLLAHYRSLFPVRLVGRALTFTNFFNFGGVFLLQWMTGVGITWLGGTETGAPAVAYTATFLAVSGLLLLSVFAYLFARDVRPSAELS